ncbi:MAG: hypothetical protein AABW80_02575 [Nanoarchaeota archaeon]
MGCEEGKDFGRLIFPKKLSLEEMARLFSFVGNNLPGEVEYGFDIGYRVGVGRITKKRIKKPEIMGVERFYGNVCDGGSMHSVPFMVGVEIDEKRKVACVGIGFQTIPGYSEAELERTYSSNPKFVRKVRKVIGRYFEVKGGDKHVRI